MPPRDQILAGLLHIGTVAQPVASAWHIITFIAVIAVASGWRPMRKTSGLLLAAPVLSAATVSWIFHNVFNGALLSLLAITLAILGLRIPATALGRPPRWALALGLAMVGLGLVYPHFVGAGSPFWYLYGAPMGILPCPTLCFVIGAALVTHGLGARSWALVLGAAGLFYGVFGVLRLGVFLDVGLVFGAAGLLALAWTTDRRENIAR